MSISLEVMPREGAGGRSTGSRRPGFRAANHVQHLYASLPLTAV